MTEITTTAKYESWNNDVKELVVACNNTPTTGETYDTDMDATNGRGAEFREIFDAVFTCPTERVDCTFSNSTGIVTLGTVSTTPASGFLTIRGR